MYRLSVYLAINVHPIRGNLLTMEVSTKQAFFRIYHDGHFILGNTLQSHKWNSNHNACNNVDGQLQCTLVEYYTMHESCILDNFKFSTKSLFKFNAKLTQLNRHTVEDKSEGADPNIVTKKFTCVSKSFCK